MGPATDNSVNRGAEGKLAAVVKMDAPALGVAFEEVEPNGVAAAAGALERDSPFVAVVADDVDGACGNMFRLLGNAAVAVSRTALEAETAPEIFGDAF